MSMIAFSSNRSLFYFLNWSIFFSVRKRKSISNLTAFEFSEKKQQNALERSESQRCYRIVDTDRHTEHLVELLETTSIIKEVERQSEQTERNREKNI